MSMSSRLEGREDIPPSLHAPGRAACVEGVSARRCVRACVRPSASLVPTSYQAEEAAVDGEHDEQVRRHFPPVPCCSVRKPFWSPRPCPLRLRQLPACCALCTWVENSNGSRPYNAMASCCAVQCSAVLPTTCPTYSPTYSESGQYAWRARRSPSFLFVTSTGLSPRARMVA